VVITSVDRDDLRDGGAQHFADCIREIRALSPGVQLETLVPDYRGRMDVALEITAQEPPDVFNHNLETVPRLYKAARPGSDYQWSLDLLQKFKQMVPHVPTKSGLMLGLGETDEEVIEVMPHARARHRHADPRPVPAAVAQPPAGAAFRAPGHLRLVRRGRLQDGLQERCFRPAGAFFVPRRPAGSRSQDQALSLAEHKCRCTPKGGIGIFVCVPCCKRSRDDCAETFHTLPAALPANACFAIVAPAGAARLDTHKVSQWFADRGYRCRIYPGALQAEGYLAGSDQQRLQDLHDAFADPAIDAILCMRGGYGSMRLLDRSTST
jgi:hypothetical protein